jgi:hypothetical protein
MLPLNDARWSTLSNAYGASSHIPQLLADAEKLPEDSGRDVEPYFSLWSALCYQGGVHAASYAALPHLVRIVEENPGKFSGRSYCADQREQTTPLQPHISTTRRLGIRADCSPQASENTRIIR